MSMQHIAPQGASHIINSFEFARTEQHMQGKMPLAQMLRVREELAGEEGEVDWALSGKQQTRLGGRALLFLTLHIHAPLHLRCTRCMQPFVEAIQIEKRFELVYTEAQADAAPMDDDEVDVIVGAERFDVAQLIEDELLLSLPHSPHHENCPNEAQATLAQLMSSSRESPFAALRELAQKNVTHIGKAPKK